MKFMKKLLSCVTSAEYAVMVAAFVAMVASYFISVLNRNFIQASMPWTEEMVQPWEYEGGYAASPCVTHGFSVISVIV